MMAGAAPGLAGLGVEGPWPLGIQRWISYQNVPPSSGPCCGPPLPGDRCIPFRCSQDPPQHHLPTKLSPEGRNRAVIPPFRLDLTCPEAPPQ